MDITTLRWFQLVADGATVTEVSELERTSQPGVSRALARLSAEVGAPLLRRDGRLLRPTQAGAVFKRHVDALLHQLDDGLAAVAQLADPEAGVVTVAFLPSLGSWLMPRLAASFLRDHPGVQLDLRPIRDEHTQATGPASEVDLEVTALRPMAETHHWRPLLREPVRLVLPEEHPLALSPAPVPLARLGGEPFVAIRPSSLLRTLVDELLMAAGIEPVTVAVVDDLPALYGYVAAGLGVSLALERPFEGATTLPLKEDGAFREIGLAWSRERRLLPSAELFREHVLREASTHRRR